MKQGVKYDRVMGFKMDAETDLESAVRTIRSAVGEDVELMVRCFDLREGSLRGCSYLKYLRQEEGLLDVPAAPSTARRRASTIST